MNENSASCVPQPFGLGEQFILTRNIRERESSTTDSAGEGPAGDAEMHDVNVSDASTEDSYVGGNTDDDDWSSPPETEGDEGPRDFDHDRLVATTNDMGEAIEYAYRVEMDYDDEHHMFDEDLSENESMHDSDASTNYEELSEPDAFVVERIAISPADEVLDVEEEESDESYHENEADIEEDLDVPEQIQTLHTELDHPTVPEGVEQHPEPKTLDQLQHADILLQKKGKNRDQKIWKLHELREALRRLEEEIPIAESELDDAETEVQEEEQTALANIEVSGLSPELFEEYKAFCESLHPEFGLRDGFSITCDQNHNGSYIQYDPEFNIFKECVEIDYTSCNWRCEASIVTSWRDRGAAVVEFWPIKPPENLESRNQSWGSLYPNLYRLLHDAAGSRSATAGEILRRLPDMNANFAGGWMFDYQYEPLLEDEPVISRRWTLRGCHFLGPRSEMEVAGPSRSG